MRAITRLPTPLRNTVIRRGADWPTEALVLFRARASFHAINSPVLLF